MPALRRHVASREIAGTKRANIRRRWRQRSRTLSLFPVADPQNLIDLARGPATGVKQLIERGSLATHDFHQHNAIGFAEALRFHALELVVLGQASHFAKCANDKLVNGTEPGWEQQGQQARRARSTKSPKLFRSTKSFSNTGILAAENLIADREQVAAAGISSLALEALGGSGVPVRCRVLPEEILLQKPVVPLVRIEVPHVIRLEIFHLTFDRAMRWLDEIPVAIERAVPLRCIRGMPQLLDFRGIVASGCHVLPLRFLPVPDALVSGHPRYVRGAPRVRAGQLGLDARIGAIP